VLDQAKAKSCYPVLIYAALWGGQQSKQRSRFHGWLRFGLKERGVEKKAVLLLHSVSTSLPIMP
jgi:hypothetical protein